MKTKQQITKTVLTETGQVLAQKSDGTYESLVGKTDWNALRSLSDEQINAGIAGDPDAIETDEDFWKTAPIVFPERKQPVFIRLDGEVLQWFKQQGRGYQTRINAILKAYVAAQTNKHHTP